MNSSLLSATGLALDMLGVTLIFFFGIMRPRAVSVLVREASHAHNDAIALLGYLALMDGLLLQLVASLALTRAPGA